MPLTKLELRPGVSKDDSPLSAEGGWIDTDKVRFRAGKPQIIGGWERMTTEQFGGKCRGLHSWSGIDGAPRLGIGTHTGLWLYYGGGLYDITPTGLTAGLESSIGGTGYGTGEYGTGTYSTPTTDEFRPRTWSLSNWGENLLANPRRGKLYEWVNVPGGLTTPAAQVTGSPDEVGSHFVTAERIVMCCGATVFGTTDFDPMMLRWSDQEDATNWTPSATNQSGDLRLSHGGRIVRGMPSRRGSLVWTDTALYALSYLGDPLLVYGVEMLGAGCGLIGSNACVEKDGAAFWMTPAGEFYAYSGGTPSPIPCPVKRYVADNLDWVQAEKIYCALNGSNNEVWWFYPDRRDGNECSRYVVFNFQENTWSVGSWNRTAWLDAGVLEYPVSADTSGNLYYQERSNTADGGAITAYAESAPIDIQDGDRLLAVLRAVPDIEDMVGGMTISFKSRHFPASSETTHGPYNVLSSTEKIDVRLTARQVALRLDSASAPSFWRLGALRLDIRETGAKR
jgi:hypothetical protein